MSFPNPSDSVVSIIGGGLAGCEAAWQLARRQVKVILYEMKPEKYSPAHNSVNLAELVCSNSFKSESLSRASGLLKRELTSASSLIMETARQCQVPAGEALAVDRKLFSDFITSKLEKLPQVTIIRQEITKPMENGPVIIATGPLTSESLTQAIAALTGDESLYFYDAIAPIIAGDSINRRKAFLASRHGRGEDAYLNCPLNEEQYQNFVDALLHGQKFPLRDFERPRFFSGCMPIEEMAARGRMTLAFGPLKPVGLVDPATGETPYAVVQLRPEDKQGEMYNMVGFQTRLVHSEQKRIFQMIPGLEKAEFIRLGSLHRNTFINAPRLLLPGLRLKTNPRIRFAGQLAGVEGYLESTAMGLWAGVSQAAEFLGIAAPDPPATTVLGALVQYLQEAAPDNFQPMAANFGIMPPPIKKMGRKKRVEFITQRALADIEEWIQAVNIGFSNT